jgi:hypothetical protein
LTRGIGVKLSALHVRENIFWKKIMVRWREISINFINFSTSVFGFTAVTSSLSCDHNVFFLTTCSLGSLNVSVASFITTHVAYF